MNDELRTIAREGALDVLVRVAPRASREAVLGVHDGALKIALCAPPVDGEANAALVAFLSRSLGLPKSAITLVGGERSRSKTVRIRGADHEALLRLLPASR